MISKPLRSNNSVVSNWGARAKPSDSRYSTNRGVPAEIMIDLANSTDKAPWFNMPHQANDAYVRAFVQLVRTRLDGSLDTGRVTCVIASQAANSWTASESLRCPLWERGPCVDHGVEALAIAPYLGDYLGQAENYRELLTWTRDSDGGREQLFDELNVGGELSSGPSGGAFSQSMQWVRNNKEVADQHGVSLIAYEGGQHLVEVGEASSNYELTKLFSRANRDAQMETLYTRYLTGWESEGGGLFLHFTDIGSYNRRVRATFVSRRPPREHAMSWILPKFEGSP